MEQQAQPVGFFKKVGKSIYGPEYYQELIEKPFSYSVKYFALFSLIAVVVLVAGFSLFSFPKINKVLNDAVHTAVESYPQELVVTFKNGNVSINADEPYFLKLPDSMKEDTDRSRKLENLITIDTKSEASADNLSKYKTAILVTKNYLVYQESNGKITTQSLEKMPDMVIDKISVTSFVDKYSPYLKLLFPLFVVGFFIFAIFFIMFRLCYLLLAALLIWLVAHAKNVEIGYGKSYQLGLHLMTLPLLIISPFALINFPIAFTLLLVILAFVNIKKKETVVAPTQSESIQEAEVKEVEKQANDGSKV
ncbi:MAG: DUF1189 family protein [Parcubacteria group bacterium]|jgi:hypothetical protein